MFLGSSVSRTWPDFVYLVLFGQAPRDPPVPRCRWRQNVPHLLKAPGKARRPLFGRILRVQRNTLLWQRQVVMTTCRCHRGLFLRNTLLWQRQVVMTTCCHLLWSAVVFCGLLWYSVACCGVLWSLWYSVVCCGILWPAVVFCGILWYSAVPTHTHHPHTPASVYDHLPSPQRGVP